MRTPTGVVLLILIMLLLDTYVFQAVRSICLQMNPKTRAVIYGLYWTIAVMCLLGFILFVYTDPQVMGKKFRTYFFAVIMGLFLAKLLAVVFLVADDIRRFIMWIAAKLFYDRSADADSFTGDEINRSAFLSWLALAAGGGLFSSMAYGFSNKYKYQVKKIQLAFERLPSSFKGLKIVHISDIHSGSFTNKDAVLHGVELIMQQNPDIILFTGDLVNDRADEMDNYKDVFGKLKAPLGVYSTLGNHDYGDYVEWPIKGLSKQQNLENLKKVHAELGWRLLMNEHVGIEKNGEQIALIGIENWSAKGRFPKHGRLDLAYAGTEKFPFKILMSHDPSHWEAQVLQQYIDVDLTLSGHTHGMQFGIEVPGFKWSPVQYVYKQWAGLYESQKQKLYVNRGFGFIGYPGRVGILPEITVIELV